MDLRLTIPKLKATEDKVVSDFSDDGPPTADSASAARNQVALLERFVRTGHETALIPRDDADFDVASRLDWLDFFKALFNTTQELVRFVEHPHGCAWDVLWLGDRNVECTAATELSSCDDSSALTREQIPVRLMTCTVLCASRTHRNNSFTTQLRFAPTHTASREGERDC